MIDVTVTVAGEAGQGVRSASDMLAKALSRSGYYVFAYPDVMSRIRGGHNFTQVRVSDQPVEGVAGRFNVLLALDRDSVSIHQEDMAEAGVIVRDGKGKASRSGRALLVPVPMSEIAKQQDGGKAGTAHKALAGMAGLGALFALVGQPSKGLEAVVKETFQRKGRQSVKTNVACLRAGYGSVEERRVKECPCAIPDQRGRSRLLLTGNQATALGALAGGVTFYAGYPMSPSTGIMEYLAARQAGWGLVMGQAEDEVAAINMVIGASYAGARAMTATSGGGFSLMVEGLGYAGMAELPLVIVLCQRPGPATGFPTRTEQAELLFVLNASQDEFPRFVFAPGNARQAFHCTQRAFELSARFQVPAIVLSDQVLADSVWTQDGKLELLASSLELESRLRPGFQEQLVRVMGSEHDEAGNASEDAGNRARMHEKRMGKLVSMGEAVGGMTIDPPDEDDCLVLCFGSTYGPVREAVNLLQSERKSVGMVHLHDIWPFPKERLLARLGRANQVIVVENNATGQLGRLLTRETRIRPDGLVLRYDGRPFSGPMLAERLRELYRGRVS